MARHEDPASTVDLERYPVSALDSPAGRALVAKCRAQLESEGACELPGFLRADALARMQREAREIAARAHYQRGAATPYLELPADHWPADHPRKRWNPFRVGAVAYDLIPREHALRRLYEWDGLTRFIAACLGEANLHFYADPLGALNVAVMGDGDELEWHFDQTDFVVSLALVPAEEGGDFLYVSHVRSGEDECYGEVAAVLDGVSKRVRRVAMEPGTLLLFMGRHSIHRVSKIRGPRERLVALLSYDRKPGTCASPLLQQGRYGRIVRPSGEATNP
jgi:hypothetical protein